MLPRVFIPQIVTRYNEAAGAQVPVFDFSPAAQFGQLTPVLGPEDNPLFIARLTDKIKKALADFSPDDFLLAVGDPSVIAVCSGIIMRRQNSIKLLKWDKRMTIYTPMEIKL